MTIEFTTMSSALRNLSGTIVLGFGIHCAGTGSGDGLPTIYYLDELVLVPYTGDPVAIEGVTLNKSTLTLSEGKTEQLVATIVPNNYTTSGEITWTSSDPTVATVDSTGKVTAVKEGNATITAKTAIDGVSVVSYEADCAVTVTPAVDEPSAPDIYFEDFYIAYEESLGVEEYNKYLDGENFKYIAQSGGVTGDTLNKFLSWEGIKEVVKSIEITIEISSAQAVTGASIQVDTLMQNKVDDSWLGSYMIQTDDTGLEIISEPYKIYRSIILSDEYWKEDDTITGKISAKLNNLKEGTNVEATITIKVTSNTK